MSFWEKGYDAVFITSYYKNPFVHSPEDTIEKMEGRYLLEVARKIARTIIGLAHEE